jgi:hypothetical protein
MFIKATGGAQSVRTDYFTIDLKDQYWRLGSTLSSSYPEMSLYVVDLSRDAGVRVWGDDVWVWFECGKR